MLNLSLSPSSSTSSSSTYHHNFMQPSVSTPTSPLANSPAMDTQNEWKQSTPIPSLMGMHYTTDIFVFMLYLPLSSFCRSII